MGRWEGLILAKRVVEVVPEVLEEWRVAVITSISRVITKV